MYEKKQEIFKSPDLSKLQEVRIDFKTSLYIALDADPNEARSRYFARAEEKNKSLFTGRKQASS